jgi:hypothetical protein
VPDGFIRIVASNRVAICLPGDSSWVTDCLNHTAPGTQPSTRPAELLASLQARGDALAANLTHQLDLRDPQLATRFVRESLIPLSRRLSGLNVRIVYLVITRDDLKRLVIGGWGGAQFHYNRVADKVAFNGSINVSPDAADGESLVPAPYLSAASVEERSAEFSADIRRTETGIQNMIARESQSTIQLTLARFIAQNGTVPLKLDLSADWFSTGVVGTLSTQSIALVTGADVHGMLQAIAQPDPRNPMSGDSIDMLHPTRPSDLRPEVAPAYADAFRKRSMRIVNSLIDRAGPDAIAKVIHALHAAPTTDGPALVQLILKTTGTDLTPDLAAR